MVFALCNDSCFIRLTNIGCIVCVMISERFVSWFSQGKVTLIIPKVNVGSQSVSQSFFIWLQHLMTVAGNLELVSCDVTSTCQEIIRAGKGQT